MPALSAHALSPRSEQASSSFGCASPIAPDRRILSIDLLRGVAVLGILVINIQTFAMPELALFNPFLLGKPDGLEYSIWIASYVLAFQKFMSIFSMLFGAGILLMCDRLAECTNQVSAIMLRRLAFLILIGLVHAYLIWSGDVLVAYGLCGIVAFLCRKFSKRVLVLLAAAMLSIATANLIGCQILVPEQQFLARAFAWLPSTPQPAAEVAAYRGSWATENAARFGSAVEGETYAFAVYTFWRVTGLMLLGMAMFRWRLFHGDWSIRRCWTMVGLAILGGMPLMLLGLRFYTIWGWDSVPAAVLAQACNSVASIPICFGWIGAALLVWKRNLFRGAVESLAKVGRMAFTNYICQSLICTTIFYGFGFGMFARFGRVNQFGWVLAIWVFQILASSQWLKYFQFGPLEWLWRSVTYLRFQPLRRSSHPDLRAI
jgi:uncharacterized protein